MTLVETLTFISTIIFIVAVVLAYFQVKETRETIKAQAILKLAEDWRNKELYDAVSYIHNLREEWKKEWKGEEDFHKFAERKAESWVAEHAVKKDDEWYQRRLASQFLSKTDVMVTSKYITPKELFGVIPEMGRLLVVLIPIERAIQVHYEKLGEQKISDWDVPVAKWEFNDLWIKFLAWHKRKQDKYELKPVMELNKLLSAEVDRFDTN